MSRTLFDIDYNIEELKSLSAQSSRFKYCSLSKCFLGISLGMTHIKEAVKECIPSILYQRDIIRIPVRSRQFYLFPVNAMLGPSYESLLAQFSVLASSHELFKKLIWLFSDIIYRKRYFSDRYFYFLWAGDFYPVR